MKLTYRPEIDGLRAIAVGAVILYHAKITILGYQPFKGGFIGVDIFFVISGYLITSIILKELVTTGSFSFKHFYERRVRRILPALLFVMLVSLPFAWMYLLPDSFVDFSKSILYSLGFSSNFYFHYSGQQYGADSGLLKPFLHTWSLSVEEQYYILFPIVLLFTFKYFRKYLVHILILGFIISLGLAEWTSRNYSSISFYFIHTRMWELLAGSILAYFEITLGHRSKNKILNLILPTLGLLLIGHSILFFNDEMFHPSFYTLSPIIGVCLIIWHSNKKELITKILSTKLFVGIGLISYSLYLWHYPIFGFFRVNDFTNNFQNQIFTVLAILIFSILSYFFVEKFFRGKNTKFFTVIFNVCLIYVSVILFLIFSIKHNGLPNRFDTLVVKLEKQIQNVNNFKHYKLFKNNKLDKTIILVGDSIVSPLAPGLLEISKKTNYNFISLYLPGCPFYDGINKVNNNKKLDEKNIVNKCNINIQNKRFKIISSLKNAIVVIGGRYQLFVENITFNNEEGGIENGFQRKANDLWIGKDKYLIENDKKKIFEKTMNRTIRKLNELGHNVILIYPIPEVGWNLPKVYINQIRNGKDFKNDNELISTSLEVFNKRNYSTIKILDSISYPNLYKIYPHKIFCGYIVKERCAVMNRENLFYMDSHHPVGNGSKIINDLIMKEIEKIELKSN